MNSSTDIPNQMVGIHYIVDLLQRSRASIYRDIARGAFPKPLKFGSSSRWLRIDIEEVIAGKTAGRAAS